MNLYDFITQDEIDSASDDPAFAFMELASVAQKRLTACIANLNEEDEGQFRAAEEARYAFVNVVSGLAKAHKVEPFASRDVPRFNKFDLGVHRQFMADLDHYMVQLAVDKRLRTSGDSTGVPTKLKEKLRTYVYGLRDAISKSSLDDAKQARLNKRLDDFEAELQKNRLNLIAVARVAIEIAAVPGALWASYEVVNKLTHNVLQVVGEAKAVDDENRKLPIPTAPTVLLPPRRDEEMEDSAARFAAGLDDEIPF
jgi:hypothetical protein